MSGYTSGLLGTARVLDQGIAFIEKPFTAHLLLTQVNSVFAAAAPGSAQSAVDARRPASG
jgi:hypothetical protein